MNDLCCKLLAGVTSTVNWISAKEENRISISRENNNDVCINLLWSTFNQIYCVFQQKKNEFNRIHRATAKSLHRRVRKMRNLSRLSINRFLTRMTKMKENLRKRRLSAPSGRRGKAEIFLVVHAGVCLPPRITSEHIRTLICVSKLSTFIQIRLILKRKIPRNNAAESDPKRRPFVCDQCGKAFTLKFSLQEHKLIHLGDWERWT